MTSPIIVGQVGVEITASARGFARKLRQAIAAEFKDANIDKTIQQAFGKRTITVPVKVEYDTRNLPPLPDVPDTPSRRPKPVKIPVKPDPLTKEFTSDIQRQLRAIAKQANVLIPVDADTEGMRREVAGQLAAIERTMRAEIPTEPEGRAAYEAKLRAMVAGAARNVQVSIPVDVDRERFRRSMAGLRIDLPAGMQTALRGVGESAEAAGSAVQGAMRTTAASFNSAVASAHTLAFGAGALAAALFGIGPAASAAAVGIGVLAGAIASIPTLLVGGAGVVGALTLGLRGLGDAFKETGKAAGGGGASAAAGARQIAAAERAIAQATRGLAAAERNYRNALADSLRAQREVNEARKAAARRIADLTRALKGAALDERDAALRVREAEAALREAYADRDPLRIERAVLELEQAQHAAEEASIAAKDAADAKAEADKRGIEGSEEVIAALDRQRAANDQMLAAADGLKSAQESLTAAQEQLAAAHEKVGGGAAGAAKEMLKLAPAAERFVKAIKDMKPAFERLRLDVQQRLFAGLDKTVKRVGEAWLPQLRTTLGAYADTFNGFFKDLGKNISTPEFIERIGKGAESARKAFERISKSISGPLVDAFGRLSEAAGPFVEALGDEIGDLVDDFSAWVKSADESGRLEEFFEKVTGYLKDFFRFGRAVGSIFKSLVQILFGSTNDGKGSGMLESIEGLADWLADPKNQEAVQEWIDDLKELARVLFTEVLPPILKFGRTIKNLHSDITGIGDSISGALDSIGRGLEDFAGDVRSGWDNLVGDAKRALSGLGDTVGGAFESAQDRASAAVTSGLDRIHQSYAALRGRVQQALSAVPGVVSALMNTSVGRGVAALAQLPGRGAAAVAGLAGRVRSALAGMYNQLYQIGRNLVFGLWNGITGLGAWFRQNLRNFAANAVNALKGAFGIGSPSKVMAREVGRWLPPGLARGMDSAIDTVEQARDRMIAAAIPDTNEQYQLRIAPVVDPLAAGGTQLAAPASSGPVVVEWRGDAPGSFIAWVRDNVRIYHGGDANAAFGRASTPQLARS